MQNQNNFKIFYTLQLITVLVGTLSTLQVILSRQNSLLFMEFFVFSFHLTLLWSLTRRFNQKLTPYVVMSAYICEVILNCVVCSGVFDNTIFSVNLYPNEPLMVLNIGYFAYMNLLTFCEYKKGVLIITPVYLGAAFYLIRQ